MKKEKTPQGFTGATTKRELRYVAAASRLVGIPGVLSRSPGTRSQKVVWFGIVTENCRNMSLLEIKKHAQMRAHSSLPSYQTDWYRMPWRDRHGWLLLAENSVDDANFFLNEYNIKLLKMKIDELQVFYENKGGMKPKGSKTLGRGGFLT